MNEFQQRQLITDIMTKAIESGQIRFDAPLVQAPHENYQNQSKPSYQGGRVTVFDLLTCIMFTLNLIGVTNINWLLVFLPFAFPHIVFYCVLWSVMLWTKFKNRKNKEDGESKTN